jgi:hypothetical protein
MQSASGLFTCCFFVLILFFLCHCSPGRESSAADVPDPSVTLVYLYTKVTASGSVQENQVRVTVSPDRTRIDCDNKTFLFIDYQRLMVLRQQPGGGPAERFSLNPVGFVDPDPNSPAAQIQAQLASFQNIDLFNDDLVTEKQLWFGYELSRMRTAAPITQRHFGQVFRERQLRCQVSRKVDQFDILAHIAEGRQAIIRANPLLLQLDPINLIPALNGLLVRAWEEKNGEHHSFVLQERCNERQKGETAYQTR